MNTHLFTRKYFLLLLLLLVIATRSTATVSLCLTDTYYVSTGYPKTWPITGPLSAGNYDPFWKVVARHVDFGGAAGLPAQAKIVTKPPSGWSGTGTWVSDSQSHASPGVPNLFGTITYRREFRICGNDSIRFSIRASVDDSIYQVILDGTIIYALPSTMLPCSQLSAMTIPVFTRLLNTGTHTLDIVTKNNGFAGNNNTGVALTGKIYSSTGKTSIVNDYQSSCQNYECIPESVQGVSGYYGNSQLFQNTPNPSSGNTVISYYITGMQQTANITVYDISGKEVITQEITSNGKGSITISDDKLTQGIYTYALIIDGYKVDTKRMVIVQ